MESPDIRIGIITPSSFFIKEAQRTIQKMDANIKLNVASASRYNAIPIGQQMETDGVEVVVSRHGTARELRKNLNIPVLSVQITSFQVFQYIKLASELGRRILLLSYEDKIEGTTLLEETFDVKIIHVNRDNKQFENIENCILYGKEQNCQVVMGGIVTSSFAEQHGLKSLEIPVSPAALRATLEDACSVVLSKRKEQERNQRYHTILNTISEGVIAVNRKGHITNINNIAGAYLGISEDQAYRRHIGSYFKDPSILKAMDTGQKIYHQIEDINNEQYLVDHVPVLKGKLVLGGVVTIRNVSNIQLAENEVRRSLTKRLVAKYTVKDFVHTSQKSKRLIEKVNKFARHETSVLISGETGTGKEILAQGIHNHSQCKLGPFVSINCGAIPDTLLESELFGYEEGAFSGSRRGGKQGLFELAHNGSIFLDEIGDAPQNVQSRLLRVLQEREVMRIGGDRLIPVNVRIISATNKNLAKEVAAGRFREDLFFRINILNIYIPPLQERIEDLPELISKLIARKALVNNLPPFDIPQKHVEQLAQLNWPGNVRQLTNFIERMVILSEGTFSLTVFEELYDELKKYSLESVSPKQSSGSGAQLPLKPNEGESEPDLIFKVLEQENFIKKNAAKKLGISRTTLWRKLKQNSSF